MKKLGHILRACCFPFSMSFARVVCVLAFLLLTWPAHAQLPVDTLLTIGDDESAGAEYLFGMPSRLVRAPDGRLFVSDQQLQHIRVYDADGVFVRKLGQRGEGPGEFERPRVLLISKTGELLVRDDRHHRVTIFDAATFELIDTLPFGFFQQTPAELVAGDWGGNLQLLEAPGGTYVMLSIGSATHEDSEKGSEKLFTHLSRDLSAVVDQFGDYGLLPLSDNFIRRLAASTHPGHALRTSAGDIWYAPMAYTGDLLKFDFDGYSWLEPQHVKGMAISGDVVETVDPADADHQRHMTTMSTRGPTLAGRFLRNTAGLVEAPDGHVLHFAYHIGDDDRGDLTMERFTSSGVLVGVYAIAADLPALAVPVIEVHDIDEDGNLYTIDRTGDAPVIRVLSVEWP